MGKQCHVLKLPVYLAGRMRNLIGLGLWAVVALVQAQGMTTQGSFSVSETGAATYAIPIQVPPGTSGMEPKLALTYNSQGGNGLLGVGWSLSGLSAITRCPRTMPQDGVRGSVNYDLNDRYCLDGQRLIAISGAYGGNGTEYRTEQESFLKAVSYGSAGNGPASFKVWTRDGLVMEYGATANSAIEAQGKPTIAVWAVNKVSDVKGNYFTVTYTKDSVNGAHYPARIDYTGNSNTGLAPNSSVQFAYENRPDVVSGYRAGSMALVNKRLLSITTYLQSAIAKSYTFNYSQSMHTSRSRLGSLKECNATGSCLPTMTFTSFESGTKAFQSPVLKIAAYGTNAGWSDDDTYPRMLIDVNGDGLPDIVGFASDGVYVSLNTGGSFAAATRWIADYSANSYCNLIAIIVIKPLPMWCGNNTTPRMLADVNGDGLPDIVGFSCEGVYVSLNTGTSFAAAKLWIASYGTRAGGWSDNNNYPRTLADVNGDGLLDIVGFASGGVYVSLNTGTSFAAPVLWIATYGKTNGWSDNNVYPRMLADVNGDGLPDIVGFGDAGAYVSLNTGTSFAPGTLWVASYGKSVGWNDSNIYPRMLADVNGDGLPDIVGFASDGVYVSLNTGTSFAAPVLWIATYGKTNGWSDSNAYPRMLADVNGDGLPDIVGFGDAGVYVSLNTGTSFAAPVLWVANYGKTGWKDNNTYPRMLVDVNGDGLPDVVGFASNGVNVSLASTQPLVDSMAGFNNGIGASVALNYKSLVDSTFYTKGANASFPVQTLQFPMYAISSVSASNGIGGTLTSNYKYGGLKAEVGKGRGLLGFAWQESTQAETGLTTRTEFRQDFPYTGMPSRVTVSKQGAGNGGLLKETVSTFACLDTATGGACAVAAGKRYFTYASQSVEKGWDLNGAALPTLTTTQQFDAWGNATMVKVSTSDGHEKITTNTYSNNATKWHLGRLLRSKVQSTAP